MWIDPADVKEWLRYADGDTSDDDVILACCAAVEPWVQRSRPDAYVGAGVDRTYQPDAEVRQAATQLAARVVRRRNSPGGLEALNESVGVVASLDPDIDRALRRGRWAVPGVG